MLQQLLQEMEWGKLIELLRPGPSSISFCLVCKYLLSLNLLSIFHVLHRPFSTLLCTQTGWTVWLDSAKESLILQGKRRVKLKVLLSPLLPPYHGCLPPSMKATATTRQPSPLEASGPSFCTKTLKQTNKTFPMPLQIVSLWNSPQITQFESVTRFLPELWYSSTLTLPCDQICELKNKTFTEHLL